ncbi:DddA-like double-stranded DNA deaminase toxin [Actinokineospora enzanensis]|uniref:DddA-like double-stranded DNA deaminase toxin n=1 Tax=Actinokineospora enzanensis TaxID=155975 RepID=UPI00146B07CD|nr:DddA-like double-stranded DNA deaminase toxin [Actinokineospora enzanensis]
MTIADNVQRLRAVLANLIALRTAMESIGEWLDQASQAAEAVLGHTSRHAQVVAVLSAARRHLEALHAALSNAEMALRLAITHHSEVKSTGSDAPRALPAPAEVMNRHGDCYPAEAHPYAGGLPPRVIRGTENAPLVGYVQLDGRDVGTVTPARTDVWAQETMKRISDRRNRRMRRIANHVEMKVATMLAQSAVRHAQIILNHAPCGSEPGDPPGCHDYLEDFVPRGCTITVFGTTQDGAPFRRTYTGKADR